MAATDPTQMIRFSRKEATPSMMPQTRKSRNACRKLVEELSSNMIPVISGMARGIDSTAHKAAIESKNRY